MSGFRKRRSDAGVKRGPMSTREDRDRWDREYDARQLRELAELPDQALRRFVDAAEAGRAHGDEVSAWVRGPAGLHEVYELQHITAELVRRGWPPLRLPGG